MTPETQAAFRAAVREIDEISAARLRSLLTECRGWLIASAEGSVPTPKATAQIWRLLTAIDEALRLPPNEPEERK